MSLDIKNLEKVKKRGASFIARCPACAENGQDRKGEHLCIDEQGRFSCVISSGGAGREHRKRIFELVGIKDNRREMSFSGKFGTLNIRKVEHYPPRVLIKNILGRLGRFKSTPLDSAISPSLEPTNSDIETYNTFKESKIGVPSVPGEGIYYTKEELLMLNGLDEQDTKKVHNIKKIFNGTVVSVTNAIKPKLIHASK